MSKTKEDLLAAIDNALDIAQAVPPSANVTLTLRKLEEAQDRARRIGQAGDRTQPSAGDRIRETGN